MKFNPNCKNPGACEDCRDRCIQDIAFLYGMSEEKQLELLRCSAHKSSVTRATLSYLG